jgi:phosphoribosyl 1,2-cyclic phosphate phosphodiesterase
VKRIFRYIFDANYKYGGIARVEMHHINGALDLFGVRFEPVKVIHGDAEIHGFRFGPAAYLTDFSEIPPESMEKLRRLDILFLDALRHRPHPTHSTVSNSLRLVDELKPQRAFFTHISHDLPHEETNQSLPDHVRLAHDGLKLEFEIA